ncbi:MAG: segregation/condensation protein A [Thermoplasmata archaeon]
MDNSKLLEILNVNKDNPDIINIMKKIENEEKEYAFESDPGIRAIMAAFKLVIEENFDPMNIDLVRFTKLYLEKLKNEHILDFISAGILIELAWEILFKKSQVLLDRVMGTNTDYYDLWEPVDFKQPEDFYDEFDYGEFLADNIPISEPIRRNEERPVTIVELINALDEALKESENRKKKIENKKQLEKYKIDIMERVHKESIEEEIEDIWNRIKEMDDEFYKGEIEDGTKEDSIKVLMALLFLELENKVSMEQEIPFGPIRVTVKVPKEQRKYYGKYQVVADIGK